MTDSNLTKEQGIALLRRLSTDDSFRELFETKPAKALHDAGVGVETIINLNARCLCKGKLASKKELAEVLDKLEEQTFANSLKMVIPSVKLPGR
jgi:putative modified peptide